MKTLIQILGLIFIKNFCHACSHEAPKNKPSLVVFVLIELSPLPIVDDFQSV